MSGNFYRAFEDRYRGAREMIEERLRAYLPFVAPLAGADGATLPAALDLGCGRGEWLELLGKHGFAARGIDLDDGMLAACRERGLAVETADAIGALRALADNSIAVVSAFHLVEHLPFDVVQELVAQSLRVLQPGGLLIMETPNPENPMVGACRFYLDPSHERPIPPNLLSFLTEYAGFARQKVVRLQEDPQLHTAAIRLIDVIDGASPDYGVVAQKAAADEVLAAFDAPFQREFGIGIGELAQRFEDGQRAAVSALDALRGLPGQAAEIEASVADLRAMLAATDTRAAELSNALSTSQLRLEQHETRLAEASLRFAEVHAQLAVDRAQHEGQRSAFSDALAALGSRVTGVEATLADRQEELARLHAKLDEANVQLVQKEQELLAMRGRLDAVLGSTSWRLTAPLRWVRRLFNPGK